MFDRMMTQSLIRRMPFKVLVHHGSLALQFFVLELVCLNNPFR
jgi:hypothetical protein